MYDAYGTPQPLDPKEHVYYYQEDPPGLVKLADPSLQGGAKRAVPWRRVYGFALNSHLLDRGFLWGSVAVFLIWLLTPVAGLTFPNWNVVSQTPLATYGTWSVGFLGIAALFAAGVVVADDSKGTLLGKLGFMRYPFFVVGFGLLALWVFLTRNSIYSNLVAAVSQPFEIASVALLIIVITVLLVRGQTKGERQNATI
jgi:hypothetical protein